MSPGIEKIDLHDLADEPVSCRLSGRIGIVKSSMVAIVLEMACHFYMCFLSLRDSVSSLRDKLMISALRERLAEVPEGIQIIISILKPDRCKEKNRTIWARICENENVCQRGVVVLEIYGGKGEDDEAGRAMKGRYARNGWVAGSMSSQPQASGSHGR